MCLSVANGSPTCLWWNSRWFTFSLVHVFFWAQDPSGNVEPATPLDPHFRCRPTRPFKRLPWMECLKDAASTDAASSFCAFFEVWAANISHLMRKTLCNFEPQISREMITSPDAKSASFGSPRTPCDVVVSCVFKAFPDVMDASCWSLLFSLAANRS